MHRSIEDFSINIFNRWGTKVYTLTDVNQKWNGKSIYGEALPEGVYFYILTAEGIEGSLRTKRKYYFIPMKILNTIFLICAFSTMSFAQISIDFGVSHANLKGDFQTDLNNPLLGKKGIYLGANKPLIKYSSLNFSFNYNNYSSNINQVNNIEELQLRYETNVLTGGVSINISPFQQSSFQPYASIGASIMHFNPKLMLKMSLEVYVHKWNFISTNGEAASLDNVFETSHSEINTLLIQN